MNTENSEQSFKNMSLRRRVAYSCHIPGDLLWASWKDWVDPIAEVHLKKYCCFVGYPRSGHSLLGALVTAHPDAMVSHELDALKYVRVGCSRRQLFQLIRARDLWFAAQEAQWNGYKYAVPGQWQGRIRTLQVIGDKKGGLTAERLSRYPWLLDKLEKTVGYPSYYVHIVRNPYDNIATMARLNRLSVSEQVETYFQMVAACDAARERTEPGRWFDGSNEELIASPISLLERLAAFFGLTPEPDWLEACAAVVFDSPTRTRDTVEWPDAVRREVEVRASKHALLKDYTFDD